MTPSGTRLLLVALVAPVLFRAGISTATDCCARSSREAKCQESVTAAEEAALRIDSEWGLSREGADFDLVEFVGRRLADKATPQRQWVYAVVKDHSLTAISVGNGRIYVSEGLVRSCETEAELAAVIAHEMGHELRGHFCDQSGEHHPGDQQIGSIIQRVDLEEEKEADEESIRLLSIAGYDPRAALRVAERLAGENSGTAAPLYGPERLHSIAGYISGWPPGGVVDTEVYQGLRSAIEDVSR